MTWTASLNGSMALEVDRLALAGGTDEAITRNVPVEAPVAIEICGISYAVMMATPHDLEDYATGFVLSEGIVASADEISQLHVAIVEGGWIVRLGVPEVGRSRVFKRARARVTESSCGLCGLENIQEVLRPLPTVTCVIALDRQAISRALDDLPNHQPLFRATGAVHAAAFCSPDGEILMVREDVGRHNALDKVIGGLARQSMSPAKGFFLLTARCSFELVEKSVRAGCPALVTISAPTSLAVERAISSGLTLVSLARTDSALVVSGRMGVGV